MCCVQTRAIQDTAVEGSAGRRPLARPPSSLRWPWGFRVAASLSPPSLRRHHRRHSRRRLHLRLPLFTAFPALQRCRCRHRHPSLSPMGGGRDAIGFGFRRGLGRRPLARPPCAVEAATKKRRCGGEGGGGEEGGGEESSGAGSREEEGSGGAGGGWSTRNRWVALPPKQKSRGQRGMHHFMRRNACFHWEFVHSSS